MRHVASVGENRNAYVVSVGKWNRPLGICRHGQKDDDDDDDKVVLKKLDMRL